jgi:hypothetical protein
VILRLPEPEAEAVLGAMCAVARAHGPGTISRTDRLTIETAGRIMLGLGEGAHAGLPAVTPGRLAAVLPHGDAATQAMRILSIMTLADGRVDAARIARVGEYAAALDVHEDYLRVLAEAAQGDIAQASACMIRRNVRSFPNLDWTRLDDGPLAPFMPYRGEGADPELEARYAALGELAPGTFGRAFFEHFHVNGFAFPGNPDGLAEGFTTPHDSSHVLSGYSTSPPGEICVSTFIGAMHPDHPLSAEVLPVLFSWHCDIELNELAGSYAGGFAPERFWNAWDRGGNATVDVVAAGWDFWGAAPVPLEELRAAYAIGPLDPALAA